MAPGRHSSIKMSVGGGKVHYSDAGKRVGKQRQIGRPFDTCPTPFRYDYEISRLMGSLKQQTEKRPMYRILLLVIINPK